MIEISNSTKVLQQHLGCNFPKFQLKATSDFRQWLKFLGGPGETSSGEWEHNNK